jgi:hypothetical protein
LKRTSRESFTILLQALRPPGTVQSSPGKGRGWSYETSSNAPKTVESYSSLFLCRNLSYEAEANIGKTVRIGEGA